MIVGFLAPLAALVAALGVPLATVGAAHAEVVLVMRVDGQAEPPSPAGVVIAAMAGLSGAPQLKLDVREGAKPAKDFKAALRKGEADLAAIPLAVLARESGLYAADQLPFLATSRAGSRRLFATLAPIVARRLAEDDLVLLALEPRPPRGLLVNRGLIGTEGLRGVRLWAPSAALRRLTEIAGAIPESDQARAEAMFVPAAEALGDGGPASKTRAGWSYYALEGWSPARAVVIRTAVLEKLPAPVRERLTTGVAENSQVWWRDGPSLTAEQGKRLADAGIAVLSPPKDLSAGLAAIGRQMAAEWMPGAGADGAEFLASIGPSPLAD
jgi:TRAP-type C4-dicarboxylate transport system substrate-binding protein